LIEVWGVFWGVWRLREGGGVGVWACRRVTAWCMVCMGCGVWCGVWGVWRLGGRGGVGVSACSCVAVWCVVCMGCGVWLSTCATSVCDCARPL
jgi:hypothetical protein